MTTINIGSPTQSNTSIVSYNYQKTQIVSTGDSFYFQSRLQTNNFSYINTSTSGEPKSIKGIAERGFFIPNTHDTTNPSIIGELIIGHKTYSGSTFLVSFPLTQGAVNPTEIDNVNQATDSSKTLYLDLNSLITYDCPGCKLRAYEYKAGDKDTDIVQIFYHTTPIKINNTPGKTTGITDIIKNYCNYPSFTSGTVQKAIEISGPKVERPISITGGDKTGKGSKQEQEDTMDFFNLNTMMKLTVLFVSVAMFLVFIRILFPKIEGNFFIGYTVILFLVAITLLTLFLISLDKQGRVKSGKKYSKMHSASVYLFVVFVALTIDYSTHDGFKGLLKELNK
jgi:hypothetical protein